MLLAITPGLFFIFFTLAVIFIHFFTTTSMMHQHAPTAPQAPLSAAGNENQGQKTFGATPEKNLMTSRKKRSLSSCTMALN